MRAPISDSGGGYAAAAYPTQATAAPGVFDYIELFYNPERRHRSNEGPSPIGFEKRHALSG